MEEGCFGDIKTQHIECRKLLIKEDSLDILSTDTSYNLNIGTKLLPSSNESIELGSSTKKFKSIYISDTPTNDSHVATKKYVDDNSGGGGGGSGIVNNRIDGDLTIGEDNTESFVVNSNTLFTGTFKATGEGDIKEINDYMDLDFGLLTTSRPPQNKTGIYIPYYQYPNWNAGSDFLNGFNGLMDILDRNTDVPVLAIINPNSGPGTSYDANYGRFIKRLNNHNVTIIGYLATTQANKTVANVKIELLRWFEFYPQIKGIFFDEVPAFTNSNKAQYIAYYNELYRMVKSESRRVLKRFITVTINTGVQNEHLYPLSIYEHSGDITNVCFDQILDHENSTYPDINTIENDDDLDSIRHFNRGARISIVHSQSNYNDNIVKKMMKYWSWIYITRDIMNNPFDDISLAYIEEMCKTFSDNSRFDDKLDKTGNIVIGEDSDDLLTINSTTRFINNININGSLILGDAVLNETELEILDGATITTTELNILDGNTSATLTTIVDADRIILNDDGTMKQVAVTDLAAYFDDEITAMPNLTSIGTLLSLAITGDLTVDTNTLKIDSTNNRVGVGTASPIRAFHIKSNGSVFAIEGNDHCYMEFYPQNQSNGRKAYFGYSYSNSNDFVFINETSSGKISFGTNSADRLTITGAGNVGIGTTSPSTPLHVNGNITCTTLLGSLSGTIAAVDNRQILPNELSDSKVQFNFTCFNNNNSSPFADGIHFNTWSDTSAGNQNLLMLRKDTFGMRIYQGTHDSSSAYSSYKDVVLADSSGKVGIGTNSPTSFLHVQANTGNKFDAFRISNYTSNDLDFTIQKVNRQNGFEYNTCVIGHGLEIDSTYSNTSGTDGKFHLNTDGSSVAGSAMVSQNGKLSFFTYQASSSSDTQVLSSAMGNMTMLASGNVGIGITNPARTLDVVSTEEATLRLSGVQDSGGFPSTLLQLEANTKYKSNGIRWQNGNSDNKWFIGTAYAKNHEEFVFNYDNTSSPSSNTFYGNSSTLTKLVIKSDGKVGIGTNSPTEVLAVAGNIELCDPSNNNATPNGKIGFNISDEVSSGIAHYGMSHVSSNGIINLSGYGGLNYYTSGTQRMTILGNGNVGINDTNPISKLQIRIDGTINDADAQDSADFADYNLCLRKEAGTITSGTEIGLCFWISGSGYDPTNARTPGAAITHERTGNWSKGKLHFKTKQSTSSAANCVTAMTISDNGNIGIGTANPLARLHIKQKDDDTGGGNATDLDDVAILIEREGHSTDGRWAIGSNYDSDAGLSDQLMFWYGPNLTWKGYVDDNNARRMNNFTGQHRCILNTNINVSSKGLIVSSLGKYLNIDNSLNTNITESLPICTITNSDNDIKVFGVISDKEDTNTYRTNNNQGVFVSVDEKTNRNEQRMFINSLGEGAIWVCNKNGVLTNGEYISSSSVPGYGMKQTLNEEFLTRYTVAKITCNCDFSLTKIVKQKLKVITTTETYEENVTQDVQKTNTETKIRYDETLQKYVEEQITTTTTEKEQVYDTFNLYDSSGNALLDADGNARTHKAERKQTLTKTITEIDYDANGDVQYEDDLDANGAQQMIFPLETRFLQADATQITESEYTTKLAAGESVYIACFVGCTYHCG